MGSHHHRWKEVRSRIAAFMVLEFLTILSIAAVCAIPARGDIAQMAYMNEGAAVHNGTHIRMPEAHVAVNITKTGSSMLTSMSAEFHISTNTTQNATLAFVPPKISLTFGGDSYFNLMIALNGSETAYSILGWEDFGVERGFATELIDALGTWLEDAQYAVFDVELQANSTVIVSAASTTSQGLSVYGIGYDYIIASARTFEGDTHEVVHMQLVEETPFLSVGFSPDSYLTLTWDEIQTDAVWDFNVSQFEYDGVSMDATVQEYRGSGQPNDPQWLFLIIEIIAITAIVATLFRRR